MEYVLLVAGGAFWTFPLLQKLIHDPVRDFAPITLIETSVNVVAMHPSVPGEIHQKETILWPKRGPENSTMLQAPQVSSAHLAAELFKFMTGVNIVRIPYKGGGQAIIDLVGGHVQLQFATATSVRAAR